MSFTESVKNEILNKPIKENCCKRAFLAGLIRGSGVLFSENDSIGVEFRVRDEETAETISRYLKNLYDYEVREFSVSEDRLNKRDNVIIGVSGDGAETVLEGLGVLKKSDDGGIEINFDMYGEVTEKECCLRSFIKGLFVSSGSVVVPDEKNAKGYHAEMVFSHIKSAEDTAEKLSLSGVVAKVAKRKGTYIVYIKSGEQIKNFVAYLQAPVSVLKLTDLMINREVANFSNRQKNCDLGNLNKQVGASAKHIKAIEKIRNTAGINSLKKELEETAVAKETYPDESLSDLAERLNITKSCLNHRLRKIEEIASKL